MIPSVSCIMMTKDRRDLVPLSLACYLEQDWTSRELIVVDDGADSVSDLFENAPECFYFRMPSFPTVGEKLNFACQQAHARILAIWDDDDWYASNRLSDQVTRLIESGKQLTGYHTILFHDGSKAYQYKGQSDYPTGTSQVFRKSFWESHPFPHINVSYDNAIWQAARAENGVIAVDGTGMVVARVHDRNVSGKRPAMGTSNDWPEVATSMIPSKFFEAMACAQ